ncbi:cysteine--tRNA ligase [Candidatus Pacearchaeota archaeon]|jgi:cysteinyl-tRNA synthetase|nr:cysteine--tRNA ligase [Candidatus Pacearchaeota archaeon]|tara:strand:+ start:4151 stop:5488 length:1338 start_codon:yes stop_codon:yes gene_type:complete
MPLKLYNTLTRKKEIFKPIHKDKVNMYVCGPTVNDIPHLGHARQQISFDVLRKYLIFLGYNIKFISNITDIEDKIIDKANELKENIEKLTKRNMKAHMEDYRKIGVKKPDIQPKATEYIKEMIDVIEKLEKKGYAYIIEDDGVYFDISKFKDYGKLSHQDIKKLKVGIRVKVKDKKRNKEDFVLWKFSRPSEPKWKSPWGEGRPGWHIECSAMSASILGLPLDIHGGGQDLIFPHHEDEIAQSEAAYDKKFSNYWVHNGMVNVDRVKMSKSLGNFRTIRDLLKYYSGNTIRYFVMSSQYRKPVDFSKKTMDNARNSYKRLKNIISEIKDDKKTNKEYLEKFKKVMDDDLNTPKALQVLWNLVRDKKAKGKYQTIKKMDEVFGFDLLKKEKIEIPKKVKELVREREKIRKEKNWEEADKIREKIKKLGYSLDDTKDGIVVRKLKKY